MKSLIQRALGRIVRQLPPTEILDGYESSELIEEIFRKAVAFVPDRRWDEFENRSAVLDFGGGFGQHYKCAVQVSPNVRWAVVETPATVQRAASLVTENLRFFTKVEAAVDWLGSTDLMHSDGALHYVPDPALALERLCAAGAKEMLWKRTFLSPTQDIQTGSQLTRLDENGPRGAGGSVSRKLVRVNVTRMPKDAFLAAHVGYSLVRREDDYFQFVRE